MPNINEIVCELCTFNMYTRKGRLRLEKYFTFIAFQNIKPLQTKDLRYVCQ